jgi:propionyl-CoA carboxylase
LPLQAEVFPDRDHFGRIFYNQARMSGKRIPQIAAVMGSCTAGGAYVPAMSDETVIVKGYGTIFLGGPPLVKAATGEVVTAEELGGADVHTRISGVADHFRQRRRARARARARNRAQPHRELPRQWDRVEPPRRPNTIRAKSTASSRPTAASATTCARSSRAGRRLGVPRVQSALRRDAGLRFRAHRGHPIGILANNGILFQRERAQGRALHRTLRAARHAAALLAEHHRLHGRQEYENRGIAKDGAKLVMAVACAEVPKFTVVIGGSFGAGNYGMCGRAYSPRQLWMWPNARISVMGGPQAASVLSTVKGDMTPEEEGRLRGADSRKYEREGSPYYSTARLWDDGIIDPLDTRRAIAIGLDAAAHAPQPRTQFGRRSLQTSISRNLIRAIRLTVRCTHRSSGCLRTL